MREFMPVQVVVLDGGDGATADLATITLLVREGMDRLEDDREAARLCLAAAERLLCPETPPPPGGLLAWQVRRVGRYLDRQIEGRITLGAAAGEVRLSPGHFSRCFRRTFGATFAKFVMRRRIERAQRLMVTSSMSLGQIALACGFADQAHFTRAFTNLTGGAPGKWRRRAADRADPRPARRRDQPVGARDEAVVGPGWADFGGGLGEVTRTARGFGASAEDRA